MKPLINPASFQTTLVYANELFLKKNADYGDSVERVIEKRGLYASLLRIDDKLNRADQLLTKEDQQVNDESLYDTLVDMANYSFMLATYIREAKEDGEDQTECDDSGDRQRQAIGFFKQRFQASESVGCEEQWG